MCCCIVSGVIRNPSCYLFDILQVMLEDVVPGMIFCDNCFVAIGKGTRTKFWLDPWTFVKLLRALFPNCEAVCIIGGERSYCG